MNSKACVLITYKTEKNVLDNSDLCIYFHKQLLPATNKALCSCC